MNYIKRPKTLEEQASLIISRGLVVNTKQELIEFLETVSYYRLSMYLYYFRLNDGTDNYRPNTTFEKVCQRYNIDRQLRLMIMNPIERFEVAIRTYIVNEHSLKYGCFGYANMNTLPKMKIKSHNRLMDELNKDENNSRDYSIIHFRSKYSLEKYLPIWIACELMNFGKILNLYQGLDSKLSHSIAQVFGVDYEVLANWLLVLLYIRNLCAHHQPLINKILNIKPKKPDKKPNRLNNMKWYVPVDIQTDRVFAVLSILNYLENVITNKSKLKKELIDLLNTYPDIDISELGIPPDWEQSPIWQ